MDTNRVGKAIAYLRKRAELTQKEIAERIGVSDKAVSKWERGLSLPDIANLGKLADLLHTDSDSLLAGDMIRCERAWQGLLILPENSNGICADTMIYDKPLVYCLLSYFLLAGIDRVRIVCSAKDERFLKSMVRHGEKLGMELEYSGPDAEKAITDENVLSDCENVMLVFDRRLIYGAGLTKFFQRAMSKRERLSLLVDPVRSLRQNESILLDEERRIVISAGKTDGKELYCCRMLPILFTPRRQLAAACRRMGICPGTSDGELTLPLYGEPLDRGFIDLSLESWDDVTEASAFVRTAQKTSGMLLYCPEEIAYRRGIIHTETLKNLGSEAADTPYGNYLLNLLE